MKRIVSVLLLVWMITGLVAAQDSDTPLVAFMNGEIYQLEGDALVTYEACTPDEDISIQFVGSPDGTKFAFATIPKIFSEAIAELGGLGDIPISLNLWYCDMTTDTLTRFFALEGNDEPFTGDFPDATPINSRPAWSPDSSHIAWSSASVDGTSYTLHIYDLTLGDITEYPLDLPPPFMFPIPPTLHWGDDNLYMTLMSFNEDLFVGEDKLYTFDFEAGEFSNEVILISEGETSDFITDKFLLNGGDDERFAIHLFGGGWYVVDIATGEQSLMNGLPMLMSSDGGDGASMMADTDENFIFSWQSTQDESLVLEGYPQQRIAISPDGTQVAYADSTLHIWTDGSVVEIANSDGFADDITAELIWGGRWWAVADGGEIGDAPLPTCEGTQRSRLRDGDTGSVISSTVPNRIRANPSISADQVGQIAPLGTFNVLDGPVCADGYAWYRIQFDGVNGWTAEGSPNEYFIAPTGE